MFLAAPTMRTISKSCANNARQPCCVHTITMFPSGLAALHRAMCSISTYLWPVKSAFFMRRNHTCSLSQLQSHRFFDACILQNFRQWRDCHAKKSTSAIRMSMWCSTDIANPPSEARFTDATSGANVKDNLAPFV